MPSDDFLMTRQNELEAVRRVVARVRTNAYQGVPGATLGKTLDDVQDLLSLVLEQNERDDAERHGEFATLLRDVEARYEGFEGVAGRGIK
ncbi:MAG: hypothetical protein H7Y38_18865 [Armatimonadetes bacterium]|nr:hypothetical protein [Armatimonadota bacterium]